MLSAEIDRLQSDLALARKDADNIRMLTKRGNNADADGTCVTGWCMHSVAFVWLSYFVHSFVRRLFSGVPEEHSRAVSILQARVTEAEEEVCVAVHFAAGISGRVFGMIGVGYCCLISVAVLRLCMAQVARQSLTITNLTQELREWQDTLEQHKDVHRRSTEVLQV